MKTRQRDGRYVLSWNDRESLKESDTRKVISSAF